MLQERSKKHFGDVLNQIAAAAAGIEPHDVNGLIKLNTLVLEATADAPLPLVSSLFDIARKVFEMRMRSSSPQEDYTKLSGNVEKACRLFEDLREAEYIGDQCTLPHSEEILMTLEILKTLLEDEEASCESASAIEQMVGRMLMSGLPEPLESALSYLSMTAKCVKQDMVGGAETAGARSALLAAENIALRLMGTSGDAATSDLPEMKSEDDDYFDEERVDRFLQEMGNLESALLNIERDKGKGIGVILSFLSELCDECGCIALTACTDLCRELRSSLDKERQDIPPEGLGFLLELKDLLEEHLCSLLETGKTGDVASIYERLRALAALMVSDAGEKSMAEEPRMGNLTLQADESELREFLAEAPDYVQMAECALLELEKDTSDSEQLNEAFRGFHNLKGSAGFLKLQEMVEVSHAAESLLAEAREGRLALSGPLADLAFEALDMIKRLLDGIERVLGGETSHVPEGLDDLVERLRSAAAGQQVETGTPSATADQIRLGGKRGGDALDDPTSAVTAERPSQAPEIVSDKESARSRSNASISGAAQDGMVRVSTQRLDALIDAVGELVISHSMVMQEREIAETKNPRLARNLSQLTKITRELQELAMSMRMVSLKTTFQKMARLARDLSAKSGVPLDFTYAGEDTEIDRSLVEEINNPLVHMVRNAVDHGLEHPEERRRLGKPEKGHIELRGYHEGGNVVIELSDDGRGLNAQAILEKAVNLGVVGKEEAQKLSDEEIHRLIFHEGLSTAGQITDISGRGVGMDVVKRTIEKLRGRVDISSRPGAGTTFTVRLPLTLAIIDGMVVRVSEEEYVVPSISIQASFRPEREQVFTVTGKGEVISLRGEIIPLFRLHRLFGLAGARQDPWDALVLIMGGNGDRCAVMVDDIVGQQQVVIKSLGEVFSRLPGVSGGAIMGSGKVALILDPPGLVSLAQGKGAA
jgi:two-component system chemotaxis sensor kinase CheA